MISIPKYYVVLWKDLNKWTIQKQLFSSKYLPKGWALVRVGDIVQQVTEREKVAPEKEYKMAGVRLYGAGTFHRETVRGRSLSASYLTAVVPNAFLYNRLFAWKGTFSVVPEEHAGCFVSNEFPQFFVDKERIFPRYLYLFFMCHSTISAVNKASIGSAAVSRNRFKEEDFLDFEIPLPPLNIQQAIIDRWEQAQSDIVEVNNQIEKLEHTKKQEFLGHLGVEIAENVKSPKCFTVPWKSIERWSVEYISRAIMGLNSNCAGKYKSLPLSTICIGQSGGTPSKSNKSSWVGSIPWVSPKDMKVFEIFDAQDHITEQAINNSSAPLIKPNSILVVVRSGILQKKVPIAINRVPVSINQDLRAFTLLDNRLIPAFVANYLQSRQDELLRLVKWSTTVQSINKEEIEAFHVPIPPLEVQQYLTNKMEIFRSEITNKHETVERNSRVIKEEIEALILGTKEIV